MVLYALTKCLNLRLTTGFEIIYDQSDTLNQSIIGATG
jgi:hypothetical protein